MSARPVIPRHWPFVVLLALLAVANSLVWSLELPGGGAAPDEHAHEAVAMHVAEHGTMPVLGEPGFEIELRPVSAHGREFPKFPYQPYATHPPGAYALSAAWLVAAGDLEAGDGFRWSRTSQFALAGALVLLAFVAARLMFPRRPELWIAGTALVALWPQVTFLHAYLNPDALATLAGAAVLCAWFIGARNGWRTRDALLLGISLAAVMLSKPTAWPLVALTVVVLVLTLRGARRRVLTRVATMAACVLVLAGPWMVQQMQRYDGDLTGVFVQRAAVRESGATPIDGPSNGVSYVELLTDYHWIGTTTRGFVLSIPTHQTTIVQLSALILLVAGGLVGGMLLFRSRRWPADGVERRVHLTALASIPAVVAIASINAWRGDIVFQGQGRYLFPVLLPILLYSLAGYAHACGRFGARGRSAGLALMLLVAVGVAVLSAVTLVDHFPGGSRIAAIAAPALPIAMVLVAAAWWRRDATATVA